MDCQKVLNKIQKDFDSIFYKSHAELNIRYIQEFNPANEYEGIKAITYDGLTRNDFKTKNFGYIGFPEASKGANVPAVVLVHGGAGYPFLKWIKEWNARGYAAIAISTVGVFPKRLNAGDVEGALSKDWVNSLEGCFAETGYIASPDNDDMRIRDTQSVDEMWMYHAVSQVLLAGKVLETFDNINKSQIGVVGISWGSVILSIALGYKNNFAYAIPVYGSGYLGESLSFMRYKFLLPRVQDLWLAEKRFQNVKIPVLWICMNNDGCFSVNSNSKSYEDTVKNNKRTTLSIKDGWIHGHSCCWDAVHYPCAEIYAFADALTGKGTFPCINEFSLSADGMFSLCFSGIVKSDVTATLYYLTDEYEYSIPFNIHESHPSHKWKKKRAGIDRSGRIVTVSIPENATCFYMEIRDKVKNITISSTLCKNM